jgi:hypothetical protein
MFRETIKINKKKLKNGLGPFGETIDFCRETTFFGKVNPHFGFHKISDC